MVAGQWVKLLLVFTSAVISGISLLEIYDQDIYSVLDMYVFPCHPQSQGYFRLAVYCQSIRFGAKPLEDHDQRFFSSPFSLYSLGTDQTENTVSSSFLLLYHVFFAVETCLWVVP
jgi:hypothetical protein